MNDERSTDVEISSSPSKARRWRRVLRAVALYGLLPYIAIVVLLASFQRSLIYHPTREKAVVIDRARLPKGRVHSVATTTRDGLTLHGWHLLPDSCSATNPDECDRELNRAEFVVLYFYGNAGSRVNDVDDCRDFTGLGCHVFLFDYRGYGDNEGSPDEAGLAADASAVWNYVVQERKVSPEKIVVFGQSLGGAVAVRLAAETCQAGTPPAGLILCSTFSSMGDVAQWHYPILPVRLVLSERFPSSERIRSILCPLLAFHGARDDIVPLEIGRGLFHAAPEKSTSGVAKRFIELKEAGHNDVPRREFQSGVRTFLATLTAH